METELLGGPSAVLTNRPFAKQAETMFECVATQNLGSQSSNTPLSP
jgi:hypothetical protein